MHRDRASRPRRCDGCHEPIAAGEYHLASEGGCHYHEGCASARAPPGQLHVIDLAPAPPPQGYARWGRRFWECEMTLVEEPTVYIASSWRNQHAVEMLTELLESRGCAVTSFVREAISDEGRSDLQFDLAKWIESDDGRRKFEYDTRGATKSDLVVYIGPSGTDAWAEVGAAWASGVHVLGLWAKGEPAGLMRRMVQWYADYRELVDAAAEWAGERRCHG